MKFQLIYLKWFITFLSISSIGQTRDFRGSNQYEMNKNAEFSFLEINKKMSLKYYKILEKNKTDTLFLKNFKISQKKWLNWRDSEIESFYPNYRDSSVFYGTMQPLCRYSKLIEWTEERIRHFDVYLGKIDKEDLCPPGRN